MSEATNKHSNLNVGTLFRSKECSDETLKHWHFLKIRIYEKLGISEMK